MSMEGDVEQMEEEGTPCCQPLSAHWDGGGRLM